MNFPQLDWTHVTRFSQAVALVLFLSVFALGFFLGRYSLMGGAAPLTGTPAVSLGEKPTADVTYLCTADKTVRAIYRSKEVELLLSDGRHVRVPQAISASGVRYASDDESFVFWSKGDTAFITEGVGDAQKTTFEGCELKPILE